MVARLRKLLFPHVYSIYCSEEVLDHGRSTPFAYHWEEVSLGSIDAIESSRPGYGPSAIKYLMQGHKGVMALVNGRVVAMAWLYTNETTSAVQVKGYYKLDPQSAYFHADWTCLEFRGRGLQAESIRTRQSVAYRSPNCKRIFANIEPSNAPSIRNYEKAGFRFMKSLRVWPAIQVIKSSILRGVVAP